MSLPQPTAIHSGRYQDHHLTVDFEREIAFLDGTPLKLTYKSYCLLAFLVRHAGELVPRETLLLSIWGYGADIRTRTLDVHVRRLRKSLGRYGSPYIETIFGIGYRFQPCQATAASQLSPTASLVAHSELASWRWKMEGTPAI